MPFRLVLPSPQLVVFLSKTCINVSMDKEFVNNLIGPLLLPGVAETSSFA